MKTISFILAIIIFNGSVNIAQAMDSYMLFGHEQKHECCKAAKDKEVDSSTACSPDDMDVEKGCCEDGLCDCKCCHMVTVINEPIVLSGVRQVFFKRIPYAFNYYHDFSKSMYIPPIAA